MLQFLLMGAQAAGIGLNMWAERRAEKFTRIGEELDKAQVQTRMQEEKLAYTQKSLVDLNRLREVQAMQRAMFGARGQLPGVGSAGALQTRSENLFNADVRAKQFSQTIKQNQLQSQIYGMNINKQGRNLQRRTKRLTQFANMFSFNALGQNPLGGVGG
jgi:hypothetical protein